MNEPDDISTLSHGMRHEEGLPTAVRWSHALVGPRLRPGDAVVDATAGNGHDTLFLAHRVLPGGRVFAFDVQTGAIDATRLQLERHLSQDEVGTAVTLCHAGHENMESHLPSELRGNVRAFMFNL